jgi:hypothetical protein
VETPGRFLDCDSTSKFQLLARGNVPSSQHALPAPPLDDRPHAQARDWTWLHCAPTTDPSLFLCLAPSLLPCATRLLMPLTATPSASPRPSTLAKMEDRKRPAISSADDLAPPSKRVAVNGSKAKDDSLEMKEESWIEVSVCHTTVFVFSTADARAIDRAPAPLPFPPLFRLVPFISEACALLSGFVPCHSCRGRSWTVVLTKPVKCSLAPGDSSPRLGSVSAMHLLSRAPAQPQPAIHIIQLCRRVETKLPLTSVTRPTQRAPSIDRCRSIVARQPPMSRDLRNFTNDPYIMTIT